ncbi:hypothetical protein Tco_0248087 [Tanacetum coccineum]
MTSSNSQMHNDIMVAGTKERPPMLAPVSYAQWKSRFMRCVGTKHNRELLMKTIYEVPHIMTKITHPDTPEDRDNPRIACQAVHMILKGIGNDTYYIVDACPSTKEMWIVIERLQQGESIYIQDINTKLLWEFGKFTTRDGESIESYYIRFYRMMTEMVRNKLIVGTMQVNVQFLQQLQPKWSRFVTIVKQAQDLDKASYHKIFDIIKQHQNKFDEIRAANPLALVVATQHYPNTYPQAPPTQKPYKAHAQSSRQTTSIRSHATTRNKGIEIINAPSPPSKTTSIEDSGE